MSTQDFGPSPDDNLFTERNDVVRIDLIDSLDEQLSSAFSAFFRQLGAHHLYGEQIAPSIEHHSARIFAAMRDRPWPPWGLGGRKIAALCQVQEIGEALYGLGPVYVAEEELTNIGLIGALLKEVLEDAARQESAEIAYLIRDGSVLGSRVFASAGFTKTQDAVVTDGARYSFYRAPAQGALDALGLAQTSAAELLSHSISDETFTKITMFYGSLYLGGHAGLVTDFLPAEIIPVLSGHFRASLPGGPPPGPPPTEPIWDRPVVVTDGELEVAPAEEGPVAEGPAGTLP